MAGTEKIMDHSEYQKRVRRMDDEALKFVIADCNAVLDAWRGHPNAGYYLDEICYCGQELGRRRKAGQK